MSLAEHLRSVAADLERRRVALPKDATVSRLSLEAAVAALKDAVRYLPKDWVALVPTLRAEVAPTEGRRLRPCKVCGGSDHDGRRHRYDGKRPVVIAPARRHASAREVGAAEAVIVEHRDWTEKVARGRAKLLGSIDVEEAVGEAMVELVKVARRWRPGAAPFKSFARPRIEGAVLDYARETDVVSREERAAIKAGRETKMSLRGLPRRIRGDVSDLEADGHIFATTPSNQVAMVELSEAMGLFRALNPRMRNIMERHIVNGEGLREIGEDLGVTESRVCQIVTEGRLLIDAERAARDQPRATWPLPILSTAMRIGPQSAPRTEATS